MEGGLNPSKSKILVYSHNFLIPYPSSHIPYPSSLIPYPPSIIHYPPSLIPHPLSHIPHPLSLILHSPRPPHPPSSLIAVVWCGVVSCPAMRCAVLCCAVLCRGAALTSSEQSVWGSVSGLSKRCSNLTLPSALNSVGASFSDSKHGSATVSPIHISQRVRVRELERLKSFEEKRTPTRRQT